MAYNFLKELDRETRLSRKIVYITHIHRDILLYYKNENFVSISFNLTYQSNIFPQFLQVPSLICMFRQFS